MILEDENQSLWEKVKGSKFFLPTIVLIGAAALTAVLLVNKPEVEEEEHEFPPLVVDVSEASLDEKMRSSLFQGEVRAKTDIELVTQVTGKVTSVSDKFIEGGHFEADEVILEIDDADYQVALKSAESAVAEAKVQLDIELASAETSKKEWQDLVGESLENANPLRLNQPQVQRARARLDAARAQLAQARLDYDRTKVRAPFTGRVMSKSAELGQFVSRGSSIGRMFSTESVEIRIPMSDLQISELGLSLGQIQSERERTEARVRAQFGKHEHSWTGYLKSVDASVDNETRLLFGTVVVENPFAEDAGQGLPLVPGLFVDVELDAAEAVAGVSIPRTALRSGDQVYLVEDGKLKFRKVDPLYTSPEVAVLSIESESSILPGQQVIVSPVPGAFEGMSVEVKQNPVASTVASPVVSEEEAAAPAQLNTQTDAEEQSDPAEGEAVEVPTTEEDENSGALSTNSDDLATTS